jgi:hypothetical protein
MDDGKGSNTWLTPVALHLAWSTPIISWGLMNAATASGGWLGGGQVPPWALFVLLPGTACLLIGLSALVHGLMRLKWREALAGAFALVSGGVQVVLVPAMLVLAAMG